MAIMKAPITWMCTINGSPVTAVDLRVDTEPIDISTMSDVQPELSWSFTDAAGHFHAYDQEGKTPTLRTEYEEYWCDDCHEEHTNSWLVCIICSEAIEPKTVDRGPTRKWIPGRTEHTLTVRHSGIPLPVGRQVSVHLTEGDSRELFGIMWPGSATFSPDGAEETLSGFLVQRTTQ